MAPESMETPGKTCTICGSEYAAHAPSSHLVEAGEWLSAEVWRDGGELCPRCLENRAMLSMMYLHEKNI